MGKFSYCLNSKHKLHLDHQLVHWFNTSNLTRLIVGGQNKHNPPFRYLCSPEVSLIFVEGYLSFTVFYYLIKLIYGELVRLVSTGVKFVGFTISVHEVYLFSKFVSFTVLHNITRVTLWGDVLIIISKYINFTRHEMTCLEVFYVLDRPTGYAAGNSFAVSLEAVPISSS